MAQDKEMLSRRQFLLSTAALAAEPGGIAETAALIRRKKVSPLELTRDTLARLEKLNARLNAFIAVTAEAALRQARELEAEQMRGRFRSPLHGIPIGLKDLYDTAGVRTTAASAHFADRVPDKDAAIVARLRQAGAVFPGKLNMDEFAFHFTSETSHFGPTQNPWKIGYTPGGSSGASAVAVSAGLCAAALGSDTGGSIRLPAALCGIVGFKPALGSLPTDGVLPLAWSLDHAGPMARTVEDARLAAAGMGLSLAAPPPLKTIRLGIPRAIFWDGVTPETERLVREAIHLLARGTAGARDVTLPPLEMDGPLPKVYSTIIMAEAFAYHEERVRRQPDKFHPATLANLKIGAAIPLSAYIHARREMDRARASTAALFTEADLLVMPAAPGPAFALGSTADLIYLRNLAPWNYYGLPGISVPCGFTRDGLPVGLQIVGPAQSGALVLAAAEAYQRLTDWHTRRPPILS
jgi:aspartyl-tRNA(Asn)/glutamyl-tRNA(Gln) amidotransferase subunit A